MSILKSFAVAVVLAAGAANAPVNAKDAFSDVPRTVEQEDARICQSVAQLLTTQHYRREGLDDVLAARFLKAYIECLDRSHLVFLQSDIDEFNKKFGVDTDEIILPSRLGAALLQGDLAPARAIHDRYVQRLHACRDQVEFILKTPADFTANELFQPDRGHAPWPKNNAEAVDLWRLQIKYERLKGRIAGEKPVETDEKISAYYARKMANAEQIDHSDLLHLYLSALAHAHDPHSDYIHQSPSVAPSGDVALAKSGMIVRRVSARLYERQTATGTERYAVLTFPKFYEGSAKEAVQFLEQLQPEKIQGLILDMRGNPGGILDESIELLSQFLPPVPVVQIKTRQGHATSLSTTQGKTLCTTPMIVLVNKTSASAAEIVAAALQDYGRAPIVGDPATFGKGTMQTLLYLNAMNIEFQGDPGQLRVTFGKFYRVTGKSVQNRGVNADIVIPPVGDFPTQEESILPNALTADEIAPADFKRIAPSPSYLLKLRERSEHRIATSSPFSFAKDEMALLRQHAANNSVPLNLDARRAEVDAENDLKARRVQATTELPPSGYTVYVLNPAVGAKEKSMTQISPTKRSATTADKEENGAGPVLGKTRDIVLDETINILSDYVAARATE